MSQRDEFHSLDDPSDGLFRELAAGVTTRIFPGDQAMLSVLTLEPGGRERCITTRRSSGA